ncbi:MAG: hypothetical protein GVY18_04400 [Bacteroidetes bacterium]|jgi:hypothetical protein|nr:hypothetical protein [Bacteroidota bacterium]
MRCWIFVLVIGLALGVVGDVRGQTPEVTAPPLRTIATFEEAQALARDGRGSLYVVDGGPNVVVQLDPDGTLLRTLGGSGTAPGAFYDPRDVDPTNGLVLVVADAGNGRLQRFSRQFVPLEVLPVVRVDRYVPEQAGQPIYSLGERGEVGTPEGRPIAVITNAADETFAVDAAQGIVLKWDPQRRLERAIGGYDAGDGTLSDPVALALDDRYLYVADRTEAGVAVYDHLGSFVRWIGRDQLVDVRALTVAEGQLWCVLPDRVRAYDATGRHRRELAIATEAPLVDVSVTEDVLYVLTSRRLSIMPRAGDAH